MADFQLTCYLRENRSFLLLLACTLSPGLAHPAEKVRGQPLRVGGLPHMCMFSKTLPIPPSYAYSIPEGETALSTPQWTILFGHMEIIKSESYAR
jgi:hypothetical protein